MKSIQLFLSSSRTGWRYSHAVRPSCCSYTVAITREVSPSIAKALTLNKGSDVSFVIAEEQHKRYVETLRAIIPTISLPYLEDHPDCVFVEDTVVAVGKRALLTRPGHVSRRGEVESMKTILDQLGMEIFEIGPHDDARLDGGDVLYTGRHMMVGLSSRTNRQGYERLRAAFGAMTEVIPVHLPEGNNALHLKSMVTHLSEKTLVTLEGPEGDLLLERLPSDYAIVRVPDLLSCNVVSVNGNVLAQESESEASKAVLNKACEKEGLQPYWIDTSELAKVNGALTCCSVLLDL